MFDCDLLIIGYGPAAWSCAMTARQRSLSVTVAAAESTATWLFRADKITNYPGMPEVSGKEMLQVFRQQAESLGAKVLGGVARQVQPMGSGWMTLVGNDIITSRSVVLAMGAARPKLLPGEEELIGQGVSWCGTCDGMFYRGREVAVLSSWHGGIEEADFLTKLCSKVDYYQMAAHELPVTPVWNITEGKPVSVEKQSDGKLLVKTSQGEKTYDGVFIFRPAVAPDRMVAGLTLDGSFIAVDRSMRTNLPHIYAAGDCTGHPLQIAKAVGEGNIAAITAAEDLQKEE